MIGAKMLVPGAKEKYNNQDEGMLELTFENIFPILGPRTVIAAMTTTATSTRIRPYSSKPCPSAFANNKSTTSLL